MVVTQNSESKALTIESNNDKLDELSTDQEIGEVNFKIISKSGVLLRQTEEFTSNEIVEIKKGATVTYLKNKGKCRR